jgi:hypothetical protein
VTIESVRWRERAEAEATGMRLIASPSRAVLEAIERRRVAGVRSSVRRQTVPGKWIVTRATRDGGKRYLVRYRLGGRESASSWSSEAA